MSHPVTDALHDIHTATNDVLKGYREMSARAEPDIQRVIRRLTELHDRHAVEQATELARMHDTGKDDRSVQGSVNRVVVVLRDWLSRLDRDALPAVREGEESLRAEYAKALADGAVSGHVAVGPMLRSQMAAIDSEIALLPQG